MLICSPGYLLTSLNVVFVYFTWVGIIAEWSDNYFFIEEHKSKLLLIIFLWCRLKSLPGSIGINKSESSSEPNITGVRVMLTDEQGASLHRDHIADQRVVAKGNNRF